jgi:hypothetical protein
MTIKTIIDRLGYLMGLERTADGWRMVCRQCGDVLDRRSIESPIGEASAVGWELMRHPETGQFDYWRPECARAAKRPAPKPTIASIPNEPASTGPAVPKRKKEELRSPPAGWKRPIYSRDWSRK